MSFRHVPRAENKAADACANRAMDGEKDFIEVDLAFRDWVKAGVVIPSTPPSSSSIHSSSTSSSSSSSESSSKRPKMSDSPLRVSPFHPPPLHSSSSSSSFFSSADPFPLLLPSHLSKIAHNFSPTFDLAHHSTPFVTQPDNFSCGYRVFQMYLGALLYVHPLTHSRVLRSLVGPPSLASTPSVPSMRQIQIGIKAAWDRGYDVSGCTHFGNKIVGSRAHVGPHEFSALLRSVQVRSNVAHLDSSGGKDSNCASASAALLDYAENHFATLGKKAPLYLQYLPHSVCVVGYRGGGTAKRALLVFDPRARLADIRREPEKAATVWGLAALKRHQAYEILELVNEELIVTTMEVAQSKDVEHKL